MWLLRLLMLLRAARILWESAKVERRSIVMAGATFFIQMLFILICIVVLHVEHDAPDGKIRIPLNEEGRQGGGQIDEFLRAYNGEGIQHIALATDDLLASWDRLKAFGTRFAPAPPQAYYDMLDARLPGHGEPVEALQRRGILIDGSTAKGDPRLLLQIFSQTMIGPVFFEFIQRKKDEGFGEGNFTALFKSMERDQLERGVLKPQADPL